MGDIEIGYLQTKIREVKIENEQLEERIKELELNKKNIDDIKKIVMENVKLALKDFAKDLENDIHRNVQECFNAVNREAYQKVHFQLNKEIKAQKVAFNRILDNFFNEVLLLRKDSSYILTILKSKDIFTEEELTKFSRLFEKEWEKNPNVRKMIEQEANVFKISSKKERISD